MQVDVRTLTLVLGLLFFVQTLVLSLQYRISPAFRGQLWIAAGNGMEALGFFFLILRGNQSLLLLSILGSNACIAAGMILIFMGILRFIDMRFPLYGIWMFYGLFLLIVLYFSVIHDNTLVRVVNLAILSAMVNGLVAYALLVHVNIHFRTTARILGGIFAAYALLFVLRLVSALAASHQFTSVFSPSFSQGIFYGGAIVLSSLYTFTYILMINQRLQSEGSESQRRFELIFETTPDAIMITRLNDGLIVAANEAFTSITGFSKDEVLKRPILSLGIWPAAEERDRFAQTLKETGACHNEEFTFHRKNGTSFTGMVSARTLTMEGQLHIISVTHDITSRKQSEEALKESEGKFRELADMLPQIVFETDARGNLTFVNRQAYPLCGYSPDDNLIGASTLSFYPPEDRARAIENIQNRMVGKPMGSNEYRIIRKDGSTFPALVHSTAIMRNGKPAGLRGMIVDISEQKETEAKIRELLQQLEIEKRYAQESAITDGLTLLYNRRHFDAMLRSDFFHSKRTGGVFSLIMLDVDYFKKYNDTYGHLAGDDCLRHIGGVLKQIVGRTHDTVARYGGEEFAVIMPETDARGALVIANRLREGVIELNLPHAASDAAPIVTISIGVVTLRTSDHETQDQVVALADEALYEAKRTGRNRVVHKNLTESEGPHQFLQLIWNPGDNCQNTIIDQEHQMLVLHSNELLECMIHGKDRQQLVQAMGNLLDEVIVHFNDEEKILAERSYPQLHEHAVLHKTLVDQALQIMESYRSATLSQGELINFLVYEVIVHHMLTEDKKYFPYVGTEYEPTSQDANHSQA